MDEVKDWLINLSIGDAYPVRDYGYKETARLANKCLALLKKQEAKNVAWSLGRAHCPTCGELFPKKKDVQYIRFCSYCGQTVKWE